MAAAVCAFVGILNRGCSVDRRSRQSSFTGMCGRVAAASVAWRSEQTAVQATKETAKRRAAVAEVRCRSMRGDDVGGSPIYGNPFDDECVRRLRLQRKCPLSFPKRPPESDISAAKPTKRWFSAHVRRSAGESLVRADCRTSCLRYGCCIFIEALPLCMIYGPKRMPATRQNCALPSTCRPAFSQLAPQLDAWRPRSPPWPVHAVFLVYVALCDRTAHVLR